MPWALKVKGRDLADFGFYVERADPPIAERQLVRQSLHGAAGVLLSSTYSEQPGEIPITGGITSTAKTVTAREANEDAFCDALRAGRVTLVRDNGSTTARQISGVARSISITTIGHPLTTSDSKVQFTLAQLDAYWLVQEWRSRVLGTTRKTTPLGTAPSTPIIRIMGSATNPVLTYRNAGGTSTRSMTFTITLGANDWLDIDMRTRLIRESVAGTVTNAYSAFTSGDFPWALDPEDGDRETAAWPTLELSTGTGLAYWQDAYL